MKQLEKHKKCPVCGNKSITILSQDAVLNEYSVKTGKLLKKHGQVDVNCWNYKCKCGWVSELNTQ